MGPFGRCFGQSALPSPSSPLHIMCCRACSTPLPLKIRSTYPPKITTLSSSYNPCTHPAHPFLGRRRIFGTPPPKISPTSLKISMHTPTPTPHTQSVFTFIILLLSPCMIASRF
ncbi:hypothetical protein GQ43DRAFT_306881 [Delitschia confertaspora ATCC 74209]|uniref:Uncharacterized protein n=1 Tax=Delitschia confertaspora ATCC 74209 TaxID=1513339 RepID=A0A9P4MTY5_9PLEO|nr:hypothetical protein GQ43DRAFT_306881 [Delitschia confertaspora ATCC 74209]